MSAGTSTIVVGTNMLIGGLLKVIIHRPGWVRSMLNCEPTSLAVVATDGDGSRLPVLATVMPTVTAPTSLRRSWSTASDVLVVFMNPSSGQWLHSGVA